MAAVDVSRLITALTIGQTFTVRTGVTIRIDGVRRTGPAGADVVIMGAITKNGLAYNPPGGWPIVWTAPPPNTSNADALVGAEAMLSDLVP